MPVDVLIGSDYYWEFVTGSVCRGVGGPAAIHIKLGWVLSGPSHDKLELDYCTINMNVSYVLHADIHFEETHTLDDKFRAFWELEALRIRDREETLYDDFTGVVKLKNERYQVPLPWREYHDLLLDTYQLSLHQLQGLLRRLRQDPNVLKEYDDII